MKKQIRKQFTLWKPGLRQPSDRSLRLIVSLLAFPLLLATGAQAALLEVDRTDDDASATACTAAPLDCSLRGAVLTANSNGKRDRIHLPAGTYRLTLVGEDAAAAVGDLDLLDDSILNPDIVLTGDGPAVSVIDAGGTLNDRVVDVLAGATIKISGLTIRGGNRLTLDGRSGGGSIRNIGGNLTLRDVTVADNHAPMEFDGWGGGVYNDGTLLIQNSIIGPNNTAHNGGGLLNNGTLEMVDTTVVGNISELAGGVRNDGGTVTILGSTFRDNIVYGQNGTGRGAGISNLGTMTIENSTFSSNVALYDGSAIESRFGTSLTLTNVTISNGPTTSLAIFEDCFGGTVTLRNSLIGGRCDACGGAFVSGGGNLESPGDTCGLTEETDQVDVVDPVLGPLMDNGGPTATHALLAGSRAIDAAVDANCPVVDQRGFLRDDRCDTGSFEFGASEKPVALTISGSGRPDIH